MEALEPRILYSADPFGASFGLAQAAEVRIYEPTPTPTPSVQRHEWAFVDPRVQGLQDWLSDWMAEGAAQGTVRQVFWLNDRSDGLAQIEAALADTRDIDALHLIGHARDGELLLGRSVIDAQGLQAQAALVRGWAPALADAADILVYGCDVAATASGQGLLQLLAQLSGADVAGSTDATGAAAQGGDWDLEYRTGAIESAGVLSAQGQAEWQGLLSFTLQGSETLVNTGTVGTQSTSSPGGGNVAMDSSGNCVVVWNDGDTGDVFFRRFDASGSAQGADTRVNITTANLQNEVQVAMDAAGNFVVVWTSQLQDGSLKGIYARRFAADGTALSGEVRVNTTTIEQLQPALAMNATGAFVVAWTDSAADGSGFGIYAQRFDAGGVPQGGEFQVNATTTNHQQHPAVAISDGGSFVVAWESLHTGTYDVYFQRFSAGGVAQGGETRANVVTGNDQRSVSVAMAADGRFVVAFEDQNPTDGSSSGIYAQRYAANGTAQGGQILVNTSTTGNQFVPAVAMDADGDFVVTWTSAHQDAQGGVYAQHFYATGGQSGPEVRINTTTLNAQVLPSVSLRGERAVVAWQGNGTGDSAGTFMQRLDVIDYSTVTVTTTSDTADGDTSSIAALLLDRGADGQVSLREAITAANNTANSGSPDRIYFNIAGTGVHTITPATALPSITDAVVIDASTDDSFAANSNRPAIVLDGNNLFGSGLTLSAAAGGSTIRGLVIRDFGIYGLRIDAGSDGNSIVGNWIGSLNAAGNDAGSGEANTAGVYIAGSNTTIGGTSAADRNVIAGNAGFGITIIGSFSVVQGNYVGVAPDGITALGNASAGITTGTAGSIGTLIGGTVAGAGNIIANSGPTSHNGVWIGSGSTEVSVLGNSIYGNTALGINLSTSASAAPKPNDVGDGDSGINNLQNHPVLATAATNASNQLIVSGTLNSTANSYYRIEFFANTSQDASGYGEGQTYLGFANVATNAAGNATISTTLTATVPVGSFISATATKSDATYSTFTDTSEFARNIAAVDSTQASVTVTTTSDTSDGDTSSISALIANRGADGFISLREAITAANNTANGNGGADRISFGIALGAAGFTGTNGIDGRWVITLASALPNITDAVVLDATTQTLAVADSNPGTLGAGGTVGTDGLTLSTVQRPEIEIVGSSAIATGFNIAANDVTVRGFAIRQIGSSGTNAAIYIGNNTTGALIEQNVLGSGATSFTDPGSGTRSYHNIYVNGADSGAIRNNLAGFSVHNNIDLVNASTNWLLFNNEIRDSALQSNSAESIGIVGSSNLTIQRNLISGSPTQGITASAGAANLTIVNNTVTNAGMGIAGSTPVQTMAIAFRTTVTSVAVERNVVTGNYGAGVTINNGAAGVYLTQNAIYNNGTVTSRNGSAATGQIGIDLNAAADNVDRGTAPFYSANDAGDADTGGNNLQNYPVLATARINGGNRLILNGTLNSTANSYYRIEFFANTSQDASGYGEGQTYLGFANVATDGAGNATVSTTLTATVPVGSFISATATKSDVTYSTFTDTSEFAANVAATISNIAPVLADTALSYTAAEDASPPSGAVGSPVSAFTGGITDADGAVPKGIAITGSVQTSGAWYYSTNGGSTWNAVGAVNDTSALLLADEASTRLYFAPAAHYNGTMNGALTLRAWDQTSGSAGSKVDASSNGGSSAFSAATDTVSVTVTAVNDAPSFSAGDGIVTTDFGASEEQGYSVTVQPDGKVLVAGYSSNGSNDTFALARYNADGTLDTSFSGDGRLTTNFGGGFDAGNSVVVQADGKILVAGSGSNGGNGDFAVARYNPDGTLDTSFSGDGLLYTAIGASSDTGTSMTLQADGKIVVAGYSWNGTNRDFALARYNSDGTPDSSLSGDGMLTTAVGTGDDFAYSVAMQADGKILVAGYGSVSGYWALILVRYNPDGTLDTSFSGDGKVTQDTGTVVEFGRSVTVQADGKILVAGSANSGNRDLALVRYNSDGTLDTGFAGDGVLTIDFAGGGDFGRSVTVRADGKIVVAGETFDLANKAKFAVARYNPDGTPDTSFSGDGQVITAIGTADGYLYSMVVQADGKIVAAGTSDDGSNLDFALVRYNSDGSLDSGFNASFTSTLGGTAAYAEGGAAVVLDADVQVFDAELSAADNFNGATLTLARNGGASAQDVFSATGTLAALTEGGALVVGGTPIGTVTTNSGGTLVLGFNANATNTLVNQAMQQIAYSNSSDAPSASVQIDWTFNDGNTGAQGSGGALSAQDSTVVNIAAVNDAPVLTAVSLSIAEGSTATLGAGNLSVTDPDSSAFIYTVSGLTGGYFQINGAPGVPVTSFTSAQLAASQVEFVHGGQDTAPAFSLTASDGAASSNTLTATVTFTALNEAPLLALGSNNLVTDGSFESGGLGWSGNAGMETSNNPGLAYGTPASPDGSWVAEVEGFGLPAAPSYIEQTITTVVGQTYVFSLLATTRSDVNVADMGALSVDGVERSRFTTDGTWRTYAVGFTATSASTVIRITSLGSQGGSKPAANDESGLIIDDVKVLAITAAAPSHVEGAAPVVLAGAAFAYDAELARSNFAGATLSVARNGGAQAQDQLAFDGVNVTAAGANLSVGGIQVGTYTFTAGQLDVSFDANATMARVNTVLQNIVYWNSSDAPPASVRLDWVLDDGNAGTQGSGGARQAVGSTTVAITTTNDAPVLADTVLSLTVAEDAGVPAGAVGSLIGAFAGGISDPDSGAVQGIAVTATVETQGTWYYSVDNGNNWLAVGAVSDASALLLADDGVTRLYFAPAADFAGASPAALTLRAWDRSSGTAGSKVSAAVNGGTTPFSSATDTVDVNVTAQNDAPVVSTPVGALAYTENQTATAIAPALTLSDVDNANLAGATVQITGNYASGEDVLAFTNQNGITGSWTAGTGTLTLSGTATRAQYEAALRSVAYANTSESPGTATRTVSFIASDGAASSSAATVDISVDSVNDAPVSTLPSGWTTAEDTPAYLTGLSVTDVDVAAAGMQLTLSVSSGSLSATSGGGVTVSNAGTASMLLTGTRDQLNAFLAGPTAIQFTPTTNANGAVTFTMVVDDQGFVGSGGSLTDTDNGTITVTAVNDAPAVTTTGSALAYVENAPATAVDSSLTVSDVDSSNLTGATVMISGNYVDGEDLLSFTNQFNITGSWNAATGTLTLSGVDSLANYEAALRSVTYQNISDNPNIAGRTVSFAVNDGADPSNVATRDITVAAVNDAPVNSVPANVFAALDTPKLFSTANGNALQISDVDAGNGAMIFTLTASNGTISLASTAGLTLSAGANGTSSVSYNGTLANINAALGAGVSFTPTSGFRGLASLSLFSTDQGNNGSGGALTDSDTVMLHVGAIVVTTTSDTANGNTASIDSLIANDGGDGISLREAITATNSTAGADRIHFQIAGTGTHTINVGSALPTIMGTVVLDASTDDSFAANGNRPAIVLDGNDLTSDGLTLGAAADGSTVRGLVIRNFAGSGLYVAAGSDGNTIVGNYIGRLQSDGSAAAVGLGNQGFGLYIDGANNTVGGGTAADRNLISGNADAGVFLDTAATGNVIQGNDIGLDASGSATLGNGGAGIAAISSADDNALLANRIVASGGLAIDLGNDGLSANDAGDGDTGPNDLQNFPVLNAATARGAQITLDGSLNSTANSWYRIEVFANSVGDPSGHGQARTYLGHVNVETDGSGMASFRSTLLANLPAGSLITATATVTDATYSSFGPTSELAANITVVAGSGPANAVPGAQSVAEDQALVFSAANGNALSVSDGVAGDARLQVTVSVTQGALTLSQTTGLTLLSGANGTAHMVVDGLESAINAALEGLVFQAPADFNGSVDLQISTALSADLQARYDFELPVTADIAAGTAQQGSLQGDAVAAVDTARGNVLSLDGAGDSFLVNGTFGNPTEVTIGGWVNFTGAGRQELISLSDRVHIALDDGSSGVKGSIQIGNNTWLDLPSGIQLSGTGWRHVMYTLSDTGNVHRLYVDGTEVASASTQASIDWFGATDTTIGRHPNNGNGLSGLVDDVRIYGRALGAAEIANLATQTFEVNGVVPITVTPVDDVPSVTTSPGNAVAMENGAAVAIDPSLTVGDIDSPLLQGANVQISAGHVIGEDLLRWVDQAGITGTWDALAGTLTLSGSALVADYEAVLRSVSYRNLSENPDTTARTVSFSVSDAASVSPIAQRQLQVISVNDAPQTGAVAVAGIEDAPSLIIVLNGSDIDGLVAAFLVTSLPANGTLYSDASLTTAVSVGSAWPATAGARLLFFVPDVNWFGSTVFSIQAVDEQGLVDASPATVTLNVSPANDLPVGLPMIDGPVQEDRTLTANLSSVSDVDGLGAVSYQWLRDGVALAGATGSSYTLGDADVLARIRLRVSYVDAIGTPETLTSAETAPVANVNDEPTGLPVVLGLVREDETLWVDTGTLADLDGLGAFSYQWVRDGVAIGGATADSYRLDDADVGAQLSVRVTYVDGHGTTQALSSASTAAVVNVNDAPVVSGMPDAPLPSITEDDVSQTGVTVAQLLAQAPSGSVHDADAGTQLGVAVVSQEPGNGRWQYSLDAGATWLDLGSVDTSLAVHLTAGDRIRFMPDTFNGTVARLAWIAWDQSDGKAAGERAAVGLRGMAGAYSAGQGAASLTVTGVNDDPVLGGGGLRTLAIEENTDAVTAVQASDVDLPSQVLNFAIAGGSDAARFEIEASTGELRLRAAPNFERPSDVDGDNVYEVQVRVSDGDGGSSLQRLSVRIQDANDAPTLSLPASVQVMQRAASGTFVAHATGQDEDSGKPLIYSLVDNAGGSLAIDAQTGRIVVQQGDRLDPILQRNWTVWVQVIDAGGQSRRMPMAVEVLALPTTSHDGIPSGMVPANNPGVAAGPETGADLQSGVSSGGGSGAATGSGSNVQRDDLLQQDTQVEVPDLRAHLGVTDDESALNSLPAGRGARRVPVEIEADREAGRSVASMTATPLAGQQLVQGGAVTMELTRALLDAAGEGINASFSGIGAINGRSWSVAPRGSGGDLRDRAEDDVSRAQRENSPVEQLLIKVTEPGKVVGVSLTAGFVWWLTRGGGLLTSMLMGVPAWRHVDLLPVMVGADDDDDDEDDEVQREEEEAEEALEGLFDRSGSASRGS